MRRWLPGVRQCGAAAETVAWLYVYGVLWLTSYVVLTSVVFGWRPVLITGGSMGPHVVAGDLVMVGRLDGPAARGTVLTFHRQGGEGLVTHRVSEVLPAGYRTRGDANPVADSDPVPTAAVVGAGRLLVPLLGRPLFWLRTGALAPLALWLLASGAAIAVIGTRRRPAPGAVRERHRRSVHEARLRRRQMAESRVAPVRRESGRLDTGTYTVVTRALVRMRVLAAAVLVLQTLLARPDDGNVAGPVLREAGLAALVLGLLTGLSALVAARRGRRFGRLLEALEHGADVIVAVAVVGATARLEVSWVLLVVPVLGGALRYRLRGAFLTWLAVCVLHLAQVVHGANPADLEFLSILGREVTRLAVVLLVALPAGYLSEHLLLEVRGLARVSSAAERRSDLLEVVAESGQRVNDLDGQVFDGALQAALGLGYSAADLWELSGGRWLRLAGSPAGALLPELAGQLDADGPAVPAGPLVIEEVGGTAAELAALDRAGLAAVVLVPVSGRRHPSLLRAVLPAGEQLHPSQVECLELLARQAGVALRNGELIADLHAARAELEHQAFHDDLTGIANRALFTRQLEECTSTAAQTGKPLALLFCDLDRFKAVNDGLGHAIGNDLLVAVVARLRTCLPGGALLARMGGDEFTLLMPDIASRAAVEAVADQVCKVLTQPFVLGDHEVVISTSVGITYGNAACRQPGELLRRGDVAMYRSKARGRGCWTEWGPELEEATLSRLQLERDLRRAVDEDDIDVVFQPVHRSDGTLAGVETLARWQHPERGTVSPEQFIAVAEDSELIVDLGRQVLRRAVEVAGPWLAGAHPECFVAVNISPRQLLNPRLGDEIDALVLGAGLAPRRLLLEITERIVTSGPEAVRALHELANRGYRLALDDFGQGQTSLQHLRLFPLTALKIDRGFVADSLTDERVRVVLRSLVRLGLELGLDVIAEGVESAELIRELQALGCTYLQGYAVAMPMPATALPPPTGPLGEVSVPSQRPYAAPSHSQGA